MQFQYHWLCAQGSFMGSSWEGRRLNRCFLGWSQSWAWMMRRYRPRGQVRRTVTRYSPLQATERVLVSEVKSFDLRETVLQGVLQGLCDASAVQILKCVRPRNGKAPDGKISQIVNGPGELVHWIPLSSAFPVAPHLLITYVKYTYLKHTDNACSECTEGLSCNGTCLTRLLCPPVILCKVTSCPLSPL